MRTSIRLAILRFLWCSSILIMALPGLGQAGQWDPPYVGSQPDVLYYPDQYAVYFRYGWKASEVQPIQIKGKMPAARYFSFNVYDDYTKSSLKALADYEIRPDAGDSSSYTFYVVPQSWPEKYTNELRMPDGVRAPSVFLRYYVARQNIYAGQPMPVIQIWSNGNWTTAPPSTPIPAPSAAEMSGVRQVLEAHPNYLTTAEKKALQAPGTPKAEKEMILSKLVSAPIFAHVVKGTTLQSYNFNGGGNYPNRDNHYLVMPAIMNPKKEVLLMKFKPPTYGTRLGDMSQQVRYYSVSLCDEYTRASLTRYDDSLRIAPDGMIYILVGRADDAALRKRAAELGVNFMPGMNEEKLVLILRHMLPNQGFANSASRVPLFNNGQPATGQPAAATIGSYAPVGIVMSIKAWNKKQNLQEIIF